MEYSKLWEEADRRGNKAVEGTVKALNVYFMEGFTMIIVEILKSNLKGYRCNAKLIDGFYECKTPFGLILYKENEVKVLSL